MPPSHNDVRDSLRGIAVGLLTPFDEEGVIDHKKLRHNARRLADQGPQAFLASANISEYHSLSQSERVDVVKSIVAALPSEACVLAGVGGSTGDARELVKKYDEIGADVMMVMPPDHTYVHEQGLLEYYRELATVTDRPLVPYIRGFDPSISFLVSLSKLDAVVGVKYALEDTVKLGAAVEAAAEDVVWVHGLAESYAVAAWAEGADGFTAGVSNFRPEIGLALYDALSAGEWCHARRLRNICLPYQRFRAETGQNNDIPGAVSVPAVKKGLELTGLHGGSVREPIRPLSSEEEQRAERLYTQLDDDIDRLIG